MSRANVAAAKRIYEARNRGDVEAVLAEFDPEVTWHPHLATLGGNPIRGHDGIREYMASLQEDWIGFRHEPEEFIDAGDKVVALLHTYARGRESGVDVEMPVAHVLTFKGGKCTGYVSYGDRAKALRAAEITSAGRSRR
jgi:ketosteroid isomerase-like protein